MMALSTSMVLAFAPLQATNGRKSTVGLSMAMLTTPPPPPATALEQVFVVQQQQSGSSTTSPMQAGAHAYLASQVDTSSLTLSLQERRPPTPEEIAAKKANFNFWFWVSLRRQSFARLVNLFHF